jgi:hypothetical protein
MDNLTYKNRGLTNKQEKDLSMAKLIDTIRALEKAINDEGWRIDFTTPVALHGVREVEAQFAFTFPEDYIEFITTHGLIDFTHINYGNFMCDMLYPALIKRRGDLVIFQKFDVGEDPDFYAFRRTGTTTAVVSYFDEGAVIKTVAPTFTEHTEMLLNSIIDGSYRIKYTPDIPYNKAAYDAEEQRLDNWNVMVATFQKAGNFLNNPK